ncbi:MAG: radical SAM protein [Planctomycetes bacterium]|nr:radical SAM protein [Planctomycetota bacterium]
MKVLIVSASFFPMVPSGAAYITGAAMQAGHRVEVFDCFMADNPVEELKNKLIDFDPDVVGVSIMLITGNIPDEHSEFYTKYFDMRPKVRDVVKVVKQHSRAPIVLGGPGFNYYGPNWFDYLGLDYGIRGECEYSFPLYLERIEQSGDIYDIPGCIYKKDGVIHKVPREWIRDLDCTALPAYQLFDINQYNERGIYSALFTKRGCAFRCTFCPYPSLEGSGYRLKSPKRVVREIEHVQNIHRGLRINISDNSFNAPWKHAQAICREIIERNLEVTWSTGGLKPIRITQDFCRLLKAAGCVRLNLAVETASARMLENMGRGYTVDHIKETLDNLSDSGIPFGLSLLFGAPGETPETIEETFRLVDRYPKIDSLWVSIGLCLWTNHQKLVESARQDEQLKNDQEFFSGANYISPQLPKEYITDLIESLRSRKNCDFQVNKPYANYSKT